MDKVIHIPQSAIRIFQLNNGDRSYPSSAGMFGFYRKTAHLKTEGPGNGVQIGHLIHVAVSGFDAGKMGLPDDARTK